MTHVKKKLLLSIMVCVVIFYFSACGTKKSNKSDEKIDNKPTSKVVENNTDEKKTDAVEENTPKETKEEGREKPATLTKIIKQEN